MNIKLSNSEGFTLIELMLAMTIFSAVMVVATVGFIGMNRTFNRGLIRKELSEYSQTVTEDVTRSVRGGANVRVDNCIEGDYGCLTDRTVICVGAVRYLWNGSGLPGGLYKDSPSSCDAPFSDVRTVMPSRYVVRDFKIERIENTTLPVGVSFPTTLFKVSGVFTTADDDALFFGNPTFDPDQVKCLGTTEAATVRTCSVERFNFVINGRISGE